MWWLLASLLIADANAARAKDVAHFMGVRDNHLTGAGLVVGLHRTGDSLRNEAAIRALAGRLQGLGVSLQVDDLTSRNIALVMVTATLPPDQRTGSAIDVSVASTGDAISLQGGTLLMTPLVGGDGQVYAVGSGPVVVGGFDARLSGQIQAKNAPNAGWVLGGGLVEREVASSVDYAKATKVDYVLDRPDFTTAVRLSEAIDKAFGAEVAEAASSATVTLTIPAAMVGKFADFAAKVEAVPLDVDAPARVVVSERTGTVVMGAEVKLAPVAVAQGGLTIQVAQRDQVFQPAPMSYGTTATNSVAMLAAGEESGKLYLAEGATIADLVAALNKMGVKPRDLIAILQAMEASGALQAQIVVM